MEKIKPYYVNVYNSAPVDTDPRFQAISTKGKLGSESENVNMQQANSEYE